MNFKTIIDEHYRKKDEERIALEPKAFIASNFIKHINKSFDQIWDLVRKHLDKDGVAKFNIEYFTGKSSCRAEILSRDRIQVELFFTDFLDKETLLRTDYDNVFLWIEHLYYGMLPGQEVALKVYPLDNGISVKYLFKVN